MQDPPRGFSRRRASICNGYDGRRCYAGLAGRYSADTLVKMLKLSGLEARVLGVLIEKALSTPDHYPLSLNAIVDGANQKNNRDPVLNVEETACFEAVEGLRAKSLAVRVDTTGGRVSKYRHALGELWQFRAPELS